MDKIFDWLSFNRNNNAKKLYFKLLPADDIDNGNTYLKSLKWAIENSNIKILHYQDLMVRVKAA